MGGQVIAVRYPTIERGNVPHKLNPRKRFSFVDGEKIRRLSSMPSRPDEDSRQTTEVDPSMMRAPDVVAKRAQMQRYVIGAAIACLATLWVAATGWLLATW